MIQYFTDSGERPEEKIYNLLSATFDNYFPFLKVFFFHFPRLLCLQQLSGFSPSTCPLQPLYFLKFPRMIQLLLTFLTIRHWFCRISKKLRLPKQVIFFVFFFCIITNLGKRKLSDSSKAPNKSAEKKAKKKAEDSFEEVIYKGEKLAAVAVKKEPGTRTRAPP